MEERVIELIARGHSIGESIELTAEIAKRFSIGSPSEIKLHFGGLDDDTHLDLAPGDVEGFDEESLTIERLEGSDHPTSITIVPSGRTGPCVLKILVKGDLYGATLAIHEIDIEVHLPDLEMTLVEHPINVSEEGPVTIPVKLHLPGSEKFSGDIQLVLLDGSDRPIVKMDPQNISFKGSRTVELDVGILDIGTYSIKVKARNKRSSNSEIFRDALIFDPKRTDDVETGAEHLAISKELPIRIVSVRFDPREVPPGGKTDLHLELDRKDVTGSALECKLNIGKIMEHLIIPEGEASTKISVRIPETVRPGSPTAIINISQEGETLAREVIPRALIITGTSEMTITLSTPSDLSDDRNGPFQSYMFPGESVRSKEERGSYGILNLTSGRHLFLREGNVVLGHRWDEGSTADVFSDLIAHEVAETFLEPKLHRILRKEIEGAGKVGVLSLMDAHDEIGSDDMWELDPPLHEAGSGGSMAEAVIVRSSSRDGSILSLARSKGLKTDPIPSIVNDIDTILDLGKDLGYLKDHYERLIREFRSQKEGPSRTATMSAHFTCLKGARKALDKLVNKDDRINGVREFIFYLITSSLVRIETLTHWTGPAMGSWDELRVERQRELKREISGLFDMIDAITSLTISMRKRLRSYKTNMEVRRNISALSRIKMIGGDKTISGTGGEIWKRKLVMDIGKEGENMEVIISLMLPSLSWNLVSPPSERDGPLFILPTTRVGKGGILEVDLEISSPSNPSSTQNTIMYIVPSFVRLEVED